MDLIHFWGYSDGENVWYFSWLYDIVLAVCGTLYMNLSLIMDLQSWCLIFDLFQTSSNHDINSEMLQLSCSAAMQNLIFSLNKYMRQVLVILLCLSKVL